jgi:hypothetical protein
VRCVIERAGCARAGLGRFAASVGLAASPLGKGLALARSEGVAFAP